MYTLVIQPRYQNRMILSNIMSPNKIRKLTNGAMDTGRLNRGCWYHLMLLATVGSLVAVVIHERNLYGSSRCNIGFNKGE